MNPYHSAGTHRRTLNVASIAGGRVEITITTTTGKSFWLTLYADEAAALREELGRLLSFASIEPAEVHS